MTTIVEVHPSHSPAFAKNVVTILDGNVAANILNNPLTQSIAYLTALTAPATLPASNRIQPTETSVFVVDATLVEYKLENDSDYHLVIHDAQGLSMIAEIPDPACVGSGSPFASMIQTARQQFDATYTVTTSFQTANVPVRLTGVGFFDFQHGQTGVAPNAIELHPIVDIQFNPGTGGPADYTLSMSPSSLALTQGTSGNTTVSVMGQNGFNGSVALAVTGLPQGVTASFNPQSTTGSSSLQLTANSSAATGTSTVTVTGTSGALTHTTTLRLTISSPSGGGQTASYNTTLKAPACTTVGSGCDSGSTLLLGRGTISGGSEPHQPNTLNNACADGTSGTFHSDESSDRLAIATTDGSNLAAGKTVRITSTVWAYDGSSDALDLYSAADANNPSWVFLNTIVPAAGGAQTLSTTFTLPTGTLQAVRANFRYQGSPGAASPGCSGGAYDDADDLVFAVGGGAANPDYALTAAPASISLTQGGTGSTTLSVNPANGFTGSVAMTASGLPAGVTAAFSPITTTSTSTLTLTASASATIGNATVTITGTSGTLTHSTIINITVGAGTSGGAQTAIYNATLKTPACASVGSSCDSGPSLLLGRATLTGGAEPHQPNTLNSSCADGTSGTFHADESNDRLKVATLDGSPLAHGKTVQVTATVWAWSTGSSDALDLYYAANANAPTWTLIKTIVPSAGGAQTLSASFVLPSGSLQAVRANFRSQGSASSCSSGKYDDHDDLVFAVN